MAEFISITLFVLPILLFAFLGGMIAIISVVGAIGSEMSAKDPVETKEETPYLEEKRVA